MISTNGTTYHDVMDIVASWAAILTATVAVFAYSHLRWERYGKRRRLERYLKAEKDAHKDRGQRTLTHLVVKLGMSGTDVMDSVFRSKHVDRKVTVARDGKADEILLEYKP